MTSSRIQKSCRLDKKLYAHGFTVDEILASISIFLIGILAVATTATYSNNVAISSSRRIVAAHLAEEGLELVRNIRDTNYLSGGTCTDGLTACNVSTTCPSSGSCIFTWNKNIDTNGDYMVQFSLTSPPGTAFPLCKIGSGGCPATNQPLAFNSTTGLFGYSGANWGYCSNSPATSCSSNGVCGAGSCVGGFSGSPNSPYTRTVTLTQFASPPSMLVKSTVSWPGVGGNQQVVLQQLLYDWRPSS